MIVSWINPAGGATSDADRARGVGGFCVVGCFCLDGNGDAIDVDKTVIVFREGHWIGREAPQLRREDLTLITGRVLVAVEALIDGMADFLQQHRLQLAGGSAL